MILDGVADLSNLILDSASAVPLYRQLADSVTRLISDGALQSGERLPPTRELASQLGLNRTTVSAAYSSLEQAGLIRGHVGRGSFVAAVSARSGRPTTNGAAAKADHWETVLTPGGSVLSRPAPGIEISFASSRPSADAFPLDQFRRAAKDVIDSSEAVEMQIGRASCRERV